MTIHLSILIFWPLLLAVVAGLSPRGIAPFIACNANRNNGLAFVFAGMTSDPTYLCTAIVHRNEVV